ncbi:MAG: cysteine desulfurase [Cytophagaceae bacterium]|jgi:cysteine desulfurase|nr:cysteine desulfurase [Cytophagaceae bacterium]
MRVYFDNAATTPLAPEVLEAMLPYWKDGFGNASSIHHYGRQARSAIEIARKKIADLVGATAAEIFFTSGGTESDNTALMGCVRANQLQHIITSRIEHHAVLHTVQYMEQQGWIQVHYVKLLPNGDIDLTHLELLLGTYPKSIVSLMHGNNEIGNLLDLTTVGSLCQEKGAIFHSDTVQTLGQYSWSLWNTPIDFIVGSAHKCNGPKGIGLLYARAGTPFHSYIHGGAQERNRRGGTENTAGIVGFAKALELSYEALDKNKQHILTLKQALIKGLIDIRPDISFNGASGSVEQSLSTVVNVALPPSEKNEMLLMNLDIAHIAASAGSACTSGTAIGSHVLEAIGAKADWGYVRFSLGKQNTLEEVKYVVNTLKEIV